ncbi:MAG TPA: DUF485 domain-containing protein [Thermoanaerobaculia bacterium]|nr:DUF485 domain-containing protein [Thermoanaerobaculia bacterium]
MTNAPPQAVSHKLLTPADWKKIEEDPEFRALVSAKRRFILPATFFFLAYFFALPLLVGFQPELMSQNVVGQINLAYLFALSQFFMAWGLAFWYLRRAAAFDSAATSIRRAAGDQS